MKEYKRQTMMLGATLIMVLLMLVGGCAQLGQNPSPPTKFEEGLYNVQTNWVPTIAWRTNTVVQTNTVTVVQTNVVAGAPQIVTNTIILTKEIPVPVQVTNQTPVYTMTPGAGATQIADVAKNVGNAVLPGIGDAVGMGLLAIFGLWGHLRSYKGGKTLATQEATSAALAQEVETIREFIKTLPSGANYDSAITSWLQKHQVQTGVASQVLGLLGDSVSNPDAQAAIRDIKKGLDISTGAKA